MTTVAQPDAQGFPKDVRLITGVRLSGSHDVTPIDPGSAEVVSADGETWLHWARGGLQRAASFRYIVELVSNAASRPPDLGQPTSAFGRRVLAGRRPVAH